MSCQRNVTRKRKPTCVCLYLTQKRFDSLVTNDDDLLNIVTVFNCLKPKPYPAEQFNPIIKYIIILGLEVVKNKTKKKQSWLKDKGYCKEVYGG